MLKRIEPVLIEIVIIKEVGVKIYKENRMVNAHGMDIAQWKLPNGDICKNSFKLWNKNDSTYKPVRVDESLEHFIERAEKEGIVFKRLPNKMQRLD